MTCVCSQHRVAVQHDISPHSASSGGKVPLRPREAQDKKINRVDMKSMPKTP